MELNFRIFNCDRTYSLDKVQALISKVTEKLSLKANVEQKYFALPRMKELCSELNEGGKMAGYAVFVVHAHESRLSLNEENAGIGYAKLYRTLLSVTDGRVLVVIGGDDNYKEDEHHESFLSQWAWRKICSQFTEDDMNGVKSFIFSWDDDHNPIHEEALEFYLDPKKAEQKFVPLPKPKITSIQQANTDDNKLEDPSTPDPEQKQPFVFTPPEHEGLSRTLMEPSMSQMPIWSKEDDPLLENEYPKALDHHATQQQEPCSSQTIQESQQEPRTNGPTEEFEKIPVNPSLTEGQVFDETKGFLRYRANLVRGQVNEVLHCMPRGWTPDKADMDHLCQRLADEPKAVLEFWADSPEGPTKPPVVKIDATSWFDVLSCLKFWSKKTSADDQASKNQL